MSSAYIPTGPTQRVLAHPEAPCASIQTTYTAGMQDVMSVDVMERHHTS